jgi:hypothetical protein
MCLAIAVIVRHRVGAKRRPMTEHDDFVCSYSLFLLQAVPSGKFAIRN